MWKKILAISLALVMVLSLAACVPGPLAQEIVDGVVESLPDIKTYRFNVDVTMGVAAAFSGSFCKVSDTADTGNKRPIRSVKYKISGGTLKPSIRLKGPCLLQQ